VRGSLAPDTVESRTGSLDSDVYILGGGFADGADRLLSGGVDNFELLFLDTLDELVVDEPSRDG
jgi:hypothetical protein